MRWLMDRGIYRILLFVIFIAGLAFVFIPLWIDWHADNGIIVELGKAFIIAGVLGITIEPLMRRAFAKDVFAAAFGYHLPDDFKAEIARISSIRIICIKHLMEVRISDVDTDRVRVRTTVERHFKNIGVTPTTLRAFMHVDEWGFIEPSKITKCEIVSSNGKRRKNFKSGNMIHHEDTSIEVRSPHMIICPDATVSTIVENTQIRSRNDHMIEWFMSPTRNPEIRIIEKPEDLDATAWFGGGEFEITHIQGRYELDGVYFPPAVMKVRWWPRKSSENRPPK